MTAYRHRLHIRLSLLALLVLIVAGVGIFAVIRYFGDMAAAESLQRQNLGLARYIVSNRPDNSLIGADGTVDQKTLTALLRDIGRINPTLEVYLLDSAGYIVGGSRPDGLALKKVDLAPVQVLTERRIGLPPLPLLGDDPRRASRAAVVSVARLGTGDTLTGYLYVVLDGAGTGALGSFGLQSRSDAQQTLLLLVTAIIAAAGLVLALILKSTLKPLSLLTERVQAFRGGSDPSAMRPEPRTGAIARHDEIGLLDQATVQMQARIIDQFADLRRSELQRRELINQVTHDLQTPLSSIRGYIETLLVSDQQIPDAQRRSHLKTALRHTRLLSSRVSDLFELSNLQAGTTPFNPESFSLAELIQDVLDDYQLQSQHSGVRMTVATDCLVPAMVKADIGLVERALRNLLDNALRHTAKGGAVEINLLADPAHPAKRLIVQVADNGEGINSAALPHVFESAWSGAASNEEGLPAGPGGSAGARRTGLGLNIVWQIALLHGSAPSVQSEKGAGSRFRFSLPTADDADR
ncbi:MAG: sensor histidine kinase [Burkholderiaceae bacterium]